MLGGSNQIWNLRLFCRSKRQKTQNCKKEKSQFLAKLQVTKGWNFAQFLVSLLFTLQHQQHRPLHMVWASPQTKKWSSLPSLMWAFICLLNKFNFGPLSTLKLQLSFGTLHLLFKRWGRPYSPNIWCRLGGGGGGGRHSQHHRRCQGGHQEEQSKELHGHKNSMCLWGYEIVFNTSVVEYSLSWRQRVPFLLVFSLNQTPFPSATSWAQTTNFHALLVPSALFFFLQTTTYVEQVLASVLKRPRERRYVVRT